MSTKYISDELKDEILAAAVLRSTIEYCVELTKKGREWRGPCGVCKSDNGLRYVVSKDLFRCVKCDDAGKFSTQYLQSQRGMGFHQSLLFLADKLNIQVPDAKPKSSTSASGKAKKKLSNKEKQMTFRDRQLKASGIPEECQQYKVTAGTVTKKFNRYRSGTLKDGKFVSVGDDMILVYRNLDGTPITYRNKKGSEMPFYRVRYKFPENNTSPKTGKPTKYASPPGSRSELWLTEYLLRQFSLGGPIKTLYIKEGEKKSDLFGAFKRLAAGIMGIHNLSTQSMPFVFEQIIRKFKIENVVLLFDADWKDLSLKDLSKSVDIRPKIFCSAAIKFKDFFYNYVQSGEFNLKILIGTHISDNDNDKGSDDMLVRFPKKKQEEILTRLDEAVISQSHSNEYWQLYDVTSWSDHKFKELWDLHSQIAFLDEHEEQLKVLTEFRLGKLRRRYNEKEQEFELAEELLYNERYWIEKEVKGITKYIFDYVQFVDFFRNRGIGLYKPTPYDRRLIHIEDNNMVKRVDFAYIQEYIIEFTLGLNQGNAIDIARFLKAGLGTYLSPTQLNLLKTIQLNFVPTAHNRQIFITKSGVLEITQDDIKLRQKINYHYFESEVINQEFTLLDPLFKATPKGDEWSLEITELGQKSEFIQYLYNTSCTYWRKTEDEVVIGPDGKETVTLHNAIKYASNEKITEEDRQSTYAYFVTKMLSIGYLLHDYEDVSLTKAIICNDLKESNRGEANGRTGKSIYAKMFKYLVKFFYIDGAKRDLMGGSGSRFLFEGVDEETKIILFDDVKDDFDFQALFSKITYGLKAENKGVGAEEVGLKKFIITLNGYIRKQDDSAKARQYHLGFTDYYRLDFSPHDHFGHNLFTEWDKEQWDLWLNFMIQCSQLYLKHKLSYTIPKAQLHRRNQKMTIGEDFMDFMDDRYEGKDGVDGFWTNLEINKKVIRQEFLLIHKGAKWATPRYLKSLVKLYAAYKGLEYNASKRGGDIKSNSKEYFCLSNDNYDPDEKKFKYDTIGQLDALESGYASQF